MFYPVTVDFHAKHCNFENMADEEQVNAGRPPKFETPEQMETAIDEYLANTPVPLITITGLCMWLGFASRQSLHDYKKRPGFSYPVSKALLAIENSYEVTLRSISAPGSIFALKNMGWKDKTENDTTLRTEGPLFNVIMPPGD